MVSEEASDESLSVSEERDEEHGHANENSRINGNSGSGILLQDSRPAYNYRKHVPHGIIDFGRWLVLGVAPNGDVKLSDREVDGNTRKAARMLSLLREYERRFGMPDNGGPSDQQWVITELTRGLYSGGTPLWTLKPAMSCAAQGLTGVRDVDFSLFPRTAFVFAPNSGSTLMFNMQRGFNVSTLTLMEKVLVRLASFASNTRSVHSIEGNSPKMPQLLKACRGESTMFGRSYRQEALAKEILELASTGMGLFYVSAHAATMQANAKKGKNSLSTESSEIQNFWTVEPSIRELFTRLATVEADRAIETIKKNQSARPLYPRPIVLMFRVVSSAGAAGLWFSASWLDMIVAGALGALVAVFEGSHLWSKNERMLLEVCASWVVGLVAGLLSISFPDTLCFGGIAVGAVVDILQGFRVVYSIMEIMSKHTVAGGADFLEAILFTGLIAYFLKFGMGTAKAVLNIDELDMNFNVCSDPINSYFYFLLVPITSLAWSVLFNPNYSDLPLMSFHGILSYTIYWAVSTASSNTGLATFVAAMSITTSAGFFSRFTGRQALGDTVTGLYVLLPGAYLAKGLFAAAEQNVVDSALLSNIIVIAVTIGLGGWAGTLLCSPTILGTNKGLVKSETLKRSNRRRSSISSDSENQQGRAMLFF